MDARRYLIGGVTDAEFTLVAVKWESIQKGMIRKTEV